MPPRAPTCALAVQGNNFSLHEKIFPSLEKFFPRLGEFFAAEARVAAGGGGPVLELSVTILLSYFNKIPENFEITPTLEKLKLYFGFSLS
ncbi:MAG: hypothetical protein FD143_3788 [Ignavibacteria bacterium]|nr:MAG: hypothetical protein FD143_3788 [Ignavibacteria bacterium]